MSDLDELEAAGLLPKEAVRLLRQYLSWRERKPYEMPYGSAIVELLNALAAVALDQAKRANHEHSEREAADRIAVATFKDFAAANERAEKAEVMLWQACVDLAASYGGSILHSDDPADYQAELARRRGGER